MKIARLQTPEGVIKGNYDDGIVCAPDGEYRVGRDGTLLPPCSPTALYCVGRNYAETLDQMDYERPDEPDFFIKPPAATIGSFAPIRYPSWTEELTYAGELAAVIDERCFDLAPEDVQEAVKGYTILNDVDALDQQSRTARKAFDTSAPLGPWIETDLDPSTIDMTTKINGQTRQDSNTKLMLFTPRKIISYLSKRFTLYPGDVIAFGSPANPGTIEPGDTIEITYNGIGTLHNSVTDNTS